MRLILVICLLVLMVACATARPGKGKGGPSKGDKRGPKTRDSGEKRLDGRRGSAKGGKSVKSAKDGHKSRSDEISVPVDDNEGSLANVQWEGLTQAQMAEFEANGVVIETNEGVPHYRFKHPGAPTDDDIVNQFPGPNNPNAIVPQNYNLEIPIKPRPSNEPGCLPMGPIGMTVEGYSFYNPYTIRQEDAVKVEVMGKCNGHPSPDGNYHHHAVNNCTFTGAPDQLLGVAFDGIPILGAVDADGNTLTSADLDMCHGRVDLVDDVPRYRYRITEDFPYILGCYRGEPRNVDLDSPNCRIPPSRGPFVTKLMKIAEKLEEALDDMDLEERREKIKDRRPSLSDGRMRTYHKALKKLFQRRFMGGY